MKYGGQDIPGSPFGMNSGKEDNSSGDSVGKTPGIFGDTRSPTHSKPLKDLEGMLLVDLIKARNLTKADMIGKSDPYAILKLGKQKEKTNTIKNTLEPQWDHHAEFTVPDGDSDTLLVEVFDADKLGKDKSLGKAEINILDLTATEGRWIPLQGREYN